MTVKECVKLQAKKFSVNEEEAKHITQWEGFGPADDGELTKRATLLEEDMEKSKARAAHFDDNDVPALTSIEDDAKNKLHEMKFDTVPMTSVGMETRRMWSVKFQYFLLCSYLFVQFFNSFLWLIKSLQLVELWNLTG